MKFNFEFNLSETLHFSCVRGDYGPTRSPDQGWTRPNSGLAARRPTPRNASPDAWLTIDRLLLKAPKSISTKIDLKTSSLMTVNPDMANRLQAALQAAKETQERAMHDIIGQTAKEELIVLRNALLGLVSSAIHDLTNYFMAVRQTLRETTEAGRVNVLSPEQRAMPQSEEVVTSDLNMSIKFLSHVIFQFEYDVALSRKRLRSKPRKLPPRKLPPPP